MPHLRVQAPDTDTVVTIQLSAGTAFLIGRQPSPTKLPYLMQLLLRETSLTKVQVPSQRVSGNHLLVLLQEGEVQLFDLASRNGTMLQLPAQARTRVEPSADVVVQLAPAVDDVELRETPERATWKNEEEFAMAVRAALLDWFARMDIRADLGLRSQSQRSDDTPLRGHTFMLADGSQLLISSHPAATMEISWSDVLDEVKQYILTENGRLEQLQGHDEGFVLASPLIRDVHREIAEAAAWGTRLVLIGPTGSGKDQLARCYHIHSRQTRGPYASLNCGLLKENLLFAQLFGAKRGSFTGCVTDIAGVVETAHEGTLFLDEIGEMDLEVQKALLRFLDSKGEYQRLGDPKPRRANVQIVCATNVELDNPQRRQGRFREDLWYRIAGKVVHVPPLRMRPDDLTAMLRLRTIKGSTLKVYDALTPAALRRVMEYDWPGNFRDLESFMERLPSSSRMHSIDAEACSAILRDGRSESRLLPREAESSSEPSAPQWEELVGIALAAFVRDHGQQPKSWGQITQLTERYVKPVFIAHATGLTQIDELHKHINCSELARRLNIADGTTVKQHLQRYILRFRQNRSMDG